MNDFQEYFIHEFVADYKAGRMSRREMMRRVLYITGGVASTASVLSLLGCGAAAAPASTGPASKAASPGSASGAAQPAASVSNQPAAGSAAAKASEKPTAPAAGSTSPISVPANDPSIDTQEVSFDNSGAKILAYQARPKSATGPLPLVLVVEQNRGLDNHIKDVVRRYAKEGYAAAAVDLLSREGGTASVADPAKIPAMLSAADVNRHVGDYQAAGAYFAKQPFVNPDHIGVTGFCFGGGIVWRAAEIMPNLKAAVPFYGAAPPLDAGKNIKAAVFGVYSSDPNDFANKDRDKLEEALKAANITYQMKVYPATRHAFYDDTNPAAYNQEQALAAWKDTLAWFAKYLR